MPPQNSEFKISDTHTAAYILTVGTSRLRRIEFDPSGRGFFVFDPPPPRGMIEDFVNGAEAPAVHLLQSLKTLQTRLRQERQAEMTAVR